MLQTLTLSLILLARITVHLCNCSIRFFLSPSRSGPLGLSLLGLHWRLHEPQRTCGHLIPFVVYLVSSLSVPVLHVSLSFSLPWKGGRAVSSGEASSRSLLPSNPSCAFAIKGPPAKLLPLASTSIPPNPRSRGAQARRRFFLSDEVSNRSFGCRCYHFLLAICAKNDASSFSSLATASTTTSPAGTSETLLSSFSAGRCRSPSSPSMTSSLL